MICMGLKGNVIIDLYLMKILVFLLFYLDMFIVMLNSGNILELILVVEVVKFYGVYVVVIINFEGSKFIDCVDLVFLIMD